MLFPELVDPSSASARVPLAEATGVVKAARSPVHGDEQGKVEEGVALCLSGGGYRATLFHAGPVWRLNELAYLPKLNRFSSVSGGSVTNGVLAMNWTKLRFDNGVASNLEELLIQPICKLALTTIDKDAVIKGILLPGTMVDRITSAYRDNVFGGTRPQDLPDEPRFVFNATNMQTGSLWRFSKPYTADHRVGVVPNPKYWSSRLRSPRLRRSADAFSRRRWTSAPSSWDPTKKGPPHVPPYRTRPFLSDGGVYDNLGLETAWKP
jgi:NTE family protein